MLDDLRSAIETLELAPVSGEMTEVVGLRDRFEARIIAALPAFIAQGDWEADGSVSINAWLINHCRMTSRDAARLIRLARRLSCLPVTATAFSEGRLSSGQVEVITGAVSNDELVSLFASQEEAVVPTLIPLDLKALSVTMATWRQRAEASLPDPPEPKAPSRSLHHSKTMDGRYETTGSFDAEGGSIIDEAIRRAATDDGEDEPPRCPAQRRADALVDISRFFLAHSGQQSSGRQRPHVNVVVSFEDLMYQAGGRVVDGGALDGPSVSKLSCDSVLHRVVVNDTGEVLDFGTGRRTISAGLWNALVIRDEHCRFPGCDRPSKWTEAHHVVWFSRGGPSAISNLVLVCSKHHHLLHLPGWGAKLKDGAIFDVSYPNGEIRSTTPPRAGPDLWQDSA